MSGITAQSVSVSHASGSTSANASSSGWVTGERIVLGTSPTGSSYSWGIAAPAASNRARSALSDTTAAAPSFVPDVGGTWLLTVTVGDSTDYTLRLTVQAAAVSEPEEAVRWSPREDSTITAPTLGLAQYFSDTFDNLACKDPSGRVWPLLLGAMGGALTDADATLTIAAGGRRVLPASTLSANRTVTLSTGGAVAGDVIEIVRLDVGAYTLAVVNGGAGAGTLLTFAVSARLYASFRFDGSNWALWERRSLS